MPPGFGPLEDLLPQGACVCEASTRTTRFLRTLDSQRNLPEANAKVLPHEASVPFDSTAHLVCAALDSIH